MDSPRRQSPKKKQGQNGKKDNDESDDGQTPRNTLDNYCIFNHSSAENIYRVK